MSTSCRFTTASDESAYDACLKSFVAQLLAGNTDNVHCVVLYGGLVRDGKPILGWSDIDLVVLFRDILARNAATLATLIDRTQAQFGIRIDLTQIDLRWLLDPVLAVNCFNSEVLNSLAMRSNVSTLIYGTLPHIVFSPEHEKMAARFYIDYTLGLFRRYLVEDVYSHRAKDNLAAAVPRITRWVFSIIRASLRLFDVYVHPYRPSLTQLETMFPGLDISIPYALLGMRDDPKKICIDPSLFASVEAFVETYSAFILREAGKQT